MGDSLWIGVDSADGSCVPTLNVFRKTGDSFELVKIINGKPAVDIYKELTEGGEETNVVETHVQGL